MSKMSELDPCREYRIMQIELSTKEHKDTESTDTNKQMLMEACNNLNAYAEVYGYVYYVKEIK